MGLRKVFKKGTVFTLTSRYGKKAVFLYCGKVKVQERAKYLLYRYDEYGNTPGYLVVNRDWLQDKLNRVEVEDMLPYSGLNRVEKFSRMYYTATGEYIGEKFNPDHERLGWKEKNG